MEAKHSSTNKLFTWDGWKKALFWIILFILILFMAYGYYRDKQELQKITETECYKKCYFEEAVEKMQTENPDKHFNCDYETFSCQVSGYDVSGFDFDIGGLNISLER